MKIDLTLLKPILENDTYALYTLIKINENLWKGIRLNKKTQEQVQVNIEKKPTVRVVDIVRDNITQHIK